MSFATLFVKNVKKLNEKVVYVELVHNITQNDLDYAVRNITDHFPDIKGLVVRSDCSQAVSETFKKLPLDYVIISGKKWYDLTLDNFPDSLEFLDVVGADNLPEDFTQGIWELRELKELRISQDHIGEFGPSIILKDNLKVVVGCEWLSDELRTKIMDLPSFKDRDSVVLSFTNFNELPPPRYSRWD